MPFILPFSLSLRGEPSEPFDSNVDRLTLLFSLCHNVDPGGIGGFWVRGTGVGGGNTVLKPTSVGCELCPPIAERLFCPGG